MFCADSASHEVTEEGNSNVISVNMNIINWKLLKFGYTTTQSHNILTVMQVIGAETVNLCCTIFHDLLMECKVFSSINFVKFSNNVESQSTSRRSNKILG